MSNTCQSDIYLFFAPPRTGNHWVEMMMAGLYYIDPIYNVTSNGLDGDCHERDSKIAVIPSMNAENPILFLERGQEFGQEVINRGKEVNLDVVRGLISSESYETTNDPLSVQWFHGQWHARPFEVSDKNKINFKYIFLKRSPQATAYSFYKVNIDRWDPNRKNVKTRDFFNYYTKEWLESLFDFYDTYDQLGKSNETYIFKYEDLISSSASLNDFCMNFIKQPPKLDPVFVWHLASFNTLVKQNQKRTFYRKGDSNSWLNELTSKEIARMTEIEKDFDFESIGYSDTSQITQQKSQSKADVFSFSKKIFNKFN